MKKLWPLLESVPQFKMYIPSEWTKPAKADRDFFCNILSFLARPYITTYCREAKAIRDARRAERALKPPIAMSITREWAEMLLEEDYQSSKLGFCD